MTAKPEVQGRDSAVPTPRVLLCLGPCHGEFYLPMDWEESPRCPVDSRHDVAVYSGIVVHRYCNDCGDELGLHRAGCVLCRPCEIKAKADDRLTDSFPHPAEEAA